MKRFMVLVFVLSACARQTSVTSSSGSIVDNAPGAPTPQAAVEKFLAAVRAQDLQAMATIWGTAKGPARDDSRLGRDELEKRELIMQCYLSHEKYRILGETRGTQDKGFRVSLSSGPITRETTFTVVSGPSSRWYVENADLQPLTDLCRNAPR